jgi:SAM-dependent methyltransferase/tRNA A-37 threonylcarbamoyl transferase component Bud32
MDYRWDWATGLDAALREAIVRAFDPGAIDTGAAAPVRGVAGRRYGVLAAPGPAGCGVFVKIFEHASLGDRVRHFCGRSGAAREFAAAARLHAMGLPVPRPLALVSEAGPLGSPRAYLLIEHLPDARPLDAALAAAGGPSADAGAALVRRVAALLADLAARGVWHKDVGPQNVLVAAADLDSRAQPRICLVDARHARFGEAELVRALERMTVTLVAFLMAGGMAEADVCSIVDAVAAQARARGGPLERFDATGVLEHARGTAADLVARQVRKGTRAAADLDAFARRYSSAGDAANYREQRFGRSGHGRKVDAAERRIVARLLAELGVAGPVLDVPCGTGRFLPILAAGGREIVGADVSADMLGLARQAMADAGLAARLIVADARRLPAADGAFELALSMRLLHRVRASDERVAVLAELARVSSRWVVFSFYNRRTWRGLRDRLRGRYGGETRGTIAAEAARAGLRLVRFVPVGPFARQTLVVCEAAT